MVGGGCVVGGGCDDVDVEGVVARVVGVSGADDVVVGAEVDVTGRIVVDVTTTVEVGPAVVVAAAVVLDGTAPSTSSASGRVRANTVPTTTRTTAPMMTPIRLTAQV